MLAGLCLGLVGCSDAPGAGVDAMPAPDSGGADTDAGEDPTGPGLAGLLADEAGRPMPEVMVLACMATSCLFGESGADGRFSFAIEAPAAVALKTLEDLDAEPRLGAALQPVRIAGDELVEVGTLHVPSLPDGVRFGPVADDPQTLAAGDGLELRLRRAALTPRIGDTLVDLAARALSPETRPALAELADAEIVAVYALHPFAATSSSPIGVRAPSTLPAGTAVEFRTISEIDGSLSEPAPGVADGSAVSTSDGSGIHELTYLVITR